mmetsp:Transcript_111219/g.314800  ORF Transcript_111219/g.314800 Transcript_111219/m.314800 type:complete len:204 (-) Transcript_111219:559-1170(-)
MASSLRMKPAEVMRCRMALYIWLPPPRPEWFCTLSGEALLMLCHSSKMFMIISRELAVSARSAAEVVRWRCSSSRRSVSRTLTACRGPAGSTSALRSSSMIFAADSTSWVSCGDIGNCWYALVRVVSLSSASMVWPKSWPARARCLWQVRWSSITAKSTAGALSALLWPTSRGRASIHFASMRSNSVGLMSWYRSSPEMTSTL